MTDRLPVHLDVDTGVDDACALLLASLHPALDLRSVTCVGGNAPVADVTRNTLTVLEAAGRHDVPVGVEQPGRSWSSRSTPGTSTARTGWPISVCRPLASPRTLATPSTCSATRWAALRHRGARSPSSRWRR